LPKTKQGGNVEKDFKILGFGFLLGIVTTVVLLFWFLGE
jgi:hypothetical protein